MIIENVITKKIVSEGILKNETILTEVKLILIKIYDHQEIIDCTLWRTKNGKVFINKYDSYNILLIENYEPIKPILVSKTEKIEMNDWIYDPDNNEIIKINSLSQISNINVFHKNCFKVIASQGHFSSKQLQMITDGQINDGDELLIECENFNKSLYSIVSYRIKLDSNFNLIIYNENKIEKDKFTFEDFYAYQIENGFNAIDFQSKDAKLKFSKWFKKRKESLINK